MRMSQPQIYTKDTDEMEDEGKLFTRQAERHTTLHVSELEKETREPSRNP